MYIYQSDDIVLDTLAFLAPIVFGILVMMIRSLLQLRALDRAAYSQPHWPHDAAPAARGRCSLLAAYIQPVPSNDRSSSEHA